MKNILKRRNKKGFTIVELVIVIGVIGILSAILIPTFVNVTENANKAKTKANLANAYSAYAAEAADRVIDASGADIEFYSQKEVGLATANNATSFYTYSDASGWSTDDLLQLPLLLPMFHLADTSFTI